MLHLVRLCGRREHDGTTALPQILDQPPRSSHRLHLLDQGKVERLLGGADVVALVVLDAVAGERGNELVAAHPDVPVDAPHRQHHVVLTERAVPRDGVVVVGVDERAVDVEDRDHAAFSRAAE